MKHTISLLVCLLLALGAPAQTVSIYDADDALPGLPIDSVLYEVVYDLYSVTPADSDSLAFHEQMLLQIGMRRAAFFSYAAYQVDSLFAESMRKGESLNVNASSQVSWKLYTNYPAGGRWAFVDKVANDRFVVYEPVELPVWQPVADSAKTLLGYPCRMAKARFKGRTWFAWYADEVPLDHGPWKLRGLPGLILQAYDAGHEFTFTAEAMRNRGGRGTMEYKGSRAIPIDRKALHKIYARYYADAIGYTLMSYPTSSRNSIRITDADGNELKHSKPVPYHLIEK